MDYLAKHIVDVPFQFWLELCEMSPYLVAGFIIAGFLSALIKPAMVERHLGGKGFLPILKAAAFGIPLPLCSCGVLPVSASLRRHGASKGATAAFLISTPETGADGILVSYSMLGPVVAVFRPVAAFVMSLLGGVLVNAFGSRGEGKEILPTCEGACCAPGGGRSKVREALRYGLVTLPQDLAGALLVGLVLAALIAALVPASALQSVGGGAMGMLVMMAASIPIYVCATASVPIAWAAIAKGISPGAALVFLIMGPVTNATTIATIWRIMGKRTAIVYFATVVAGAVASGTMLNALDGIFSFNIASHIQGHVHQHETTGGMFATVSSVVLLAMLGLGLYRSMREKMAGVPKAAKEAHGEEALTTLAVEGMKCSHCATAIERALGGCQGVCEVRVDLHGKKAFVKGHDVDEERLRSTVRELGYTLPDEAAKSGKEAAKPVRR
jgi:uncharacterized protein